MLTDAVKIYSLGARSASVPLKAEVLAKINVTSGRRGGNIGLLKDGRIDWPLLLRRKAFSKERDQTNGLIARAQNQAAQGQIDAEILEDLISAANELQRRLTNLAKTLRDDATWTPTMYLDAKSWLNQLDDALKVLQQPDAAAYLTGKYAARGSTVAELVQYMKHNGLQFAPCLAGGEAAYMALYRALRDYDTEGGSAVRPRR
ncbi:MAG: hypothetical protein E6K70_11700 [Planctomycetota bacterium]|nr:MAG: hypothetical protein E6K70_11700 [Planctomycetota bacterium]